MSFNEMLAVELVAGVAVSRPLIRHTVAVIKGLLLLVVVAR